jgi:hypothetical protein
MQEDGESAVAYPAPLPGCPDHHFRFLLKYISRDEVDLLSRGGGGAVEVRSAIEQFTEKSPLYGFVQYRRRKVLLKYIPEGTSRLLQGTGAYPHPDDLLTGAPYM